MSEKPTRDMALVEVRRALSAAFPDEPSRVDGILEALDVTVASDILRISEQARALVAEESNRRQDRIRRLEAELGSERNRSAAAQMLVDIIAADPEFARSINLRYREIVRTAARAGVPRSKVQERKRAMHRRRQR